MQIVGDRDRVRFVQLKKVGDDPFEGGHRLGVSRSPMCWLMNTCRPTLERDVVLQVRADRQDGRDVLGQRDRQRRIAAGAAQQSRVATHDPGHAVIHMTGDGPVVDQEEVGDVTQPLHAPRPHPCKSVHRSGCRWSRRPGSPSHA